MKVTKHGFISDGRTSNVFTFDEEFARKLGVSPNCSQEELRAACEPKSCSYNNKKKFSGKSRWKKNQKETQQQKTCNTCANASDGHSCNSVFCAHSQWCSKQRKSEVTSDINQKTKISMNIILSNVDGLQINGRKIGSKVQQEIRESHILTEPGNAAMEQLLFDITVDELIDILQTSFLKVRILNGLPGAFNDNDSFKQFAQALLVKSQSVSAAQ